MAVIGEDIGPTIALDGARKVRGNLTQARIRWMVLAMVLGFGLVGARLVQLGMVVPDSTIEGQARDLITATRPPILDRNGLEMAVDIRVPSLFAEPRRIIDVEEAVEKLRTVLPDLDEAWLRNRLTGDKGFVWVERELSPVIQDRVMRLGIPGIDFITESKRFYPGMTEASHILGSTNIDNQGISGIEKHMDGEDVALLQDLGLARGNALAPVELSVDMRVQHIMHEQMLDALTRYQCPAQVEVAVPVGRYPTARYSLVRAWPVTGRNHQIRRHFKHLRHPLVVDPEYGDAHHNRFFRERYGRRLMLHAWTLEFPDRGVRIQARIPEDMAFILEDLGLVVPPPFV